MTSVNLLRYFVFALSFMFVKNSAFAGPRIPFGKADKISIVFDLPNTPQFKESESSTTYLDLARLHQEYNVAWLPLWVTEEPKLVLAKKNSDEYFELSEEQVNALVSEYKLDKAQLLKLGAFTRYGGKAIMLILLGIILYGFFSKDKKAEIVPKHM